MFRRSCFLTDPGQAGGVGGTDEVREADGVSGKGGSQESAVKSRESASRPEGSAVGPQESAV
jgi:hypothetical protein